MGPLSRGFPGEPRFYRLTSMLQRVQATFTAQPISAITGCVAVLLVAEEYVSASSRDSLGLQELGNWLRALIL